MPRWLLIWEIKKCDEFRIEHKLAISSFELKGIKAVSGPLSQNSDTVPLSDRKLTAANIHVDCRVYCKSLYFNETDCVPTLLYVLETK